MPYSPSRPSNITSVDDLLQFVLDEFLQIAQELREFTEVELRPSYREPTKPREGMIVYADGTVWNPGGGAGVYVYSGGAWVKL